MTALGGGVREVEGVGRLVTPLVVSIANGRTINQGGPLTITTRSVATGYVVYVSLKT